MYCPEHLLFRSKYLWIWHWQHADVDRKYVPLGVKLNPLRYEISLKIGKWHHDFNEEAWLNRAFSNLTWKLYRKRRFERLHPETSDQPKWEK